MIIYRKLDKTGYIYHYKNDNIIIGNSKHTFLFRPFRISVSDDIEKFELKQTAHLLKIINSLPLLNIKTFTPFYLFKNGEKVAKLKTKIFKPIFYFTLDGNEYTLIHKGNNSIIFLCNDKQIARYTKETLAVAEQNTYVVDFNAETMSKTFVLLMCIFIDVIFYPNRMHIDYVKLEYM